MLPRSSVLIVDDDEDARAVISTMLGNAGYDTALARDGREALHLVTAGMLPDAIVLDLRMPVMDGRDVIRVLRSYSRLALIPIIVVSAYPVDPELAKSCQGVIAKQQLQDKLIPMVRSFARGTFPPIAS